MKKTLKRTLATFLTVIMLFSALPLAVSAATVNDLGYSISNGKVTITYCDRNASGELVIPSKIDGYPVTSIGYNAFFYCLYLKSIKISEGITSIGDWAFDGCSSLTSVTIPDSVTSIGDYAFYDCTSLTSIIIPDSVTSIGDHAFEGCSSLTSVTIPDSVTSIGDHAFGFCSSLTSIIIPDSVTSIGCYAFVHCYSLTSVTIGNGVTSIGDWAFDGCSSLTSITIPDSVTSIGEAFSRCDSLTSITIPDSVTSIRDFAFYYCDNLTDVYYNGTEEQWDKISIGICNSCLTNATIHYNYIDDTPSSTNYITGTFESYVIATDYSGKAWISSVKINGTNYDVKKNLLPFKSTSEYDPYIGQKVVAEVNQGSIVRFEFVTNLESKLNCTFSTDKDQITYTNKKYSDKNINLDIYLYNRCSDPLAYEEKSLDIYVNNVTFSTSNPDLIRFKDSDKNNEKSISIEKNISCGNNLKLIPDANEVLDVKTTYKIKDNVPYESVIIYCNADAIQNGQARQYSFSKEIRIINNNYTKPINTSNEVKKAAEELSKIYGAITLGDTDLNGSLSKLCTRQQLDKIEELLYCAVAVYECPKDSFDKYLTNKVFEKIFGVNPDTFKVYNGTVALITFVNNKDFGPLEIVFSVNLNRLSIFGYDIGSYSFDINYEVVGGKGKKKITSDIALSGKAGMLAQGNFKNFFDAVEEVALSELKEAYNIFRGNDLNKAVNVLFGNTFNDILGQASKLGLSKYGSTSDIEWAVLTSTEKIIKIKCPVDVYVYNSNNDLVASVIGDDVSTIDETITIDLNGDEKNITLYNDNYLIKYISAADGELNITVYEYANDKGLLRTVDINNVPLKVGIDYTQNIDDEYFNDSDYSLTSNEDIVYSHSFDDCALHTHQPDGEWAESGMGYKYSLCPICNEWVIELSDVYYKVNSVAINDINVNYKSSAKIVPQISVDDGVNYTVKYESSNPSVATVDKDGNISTVHKGSTTITCTVTDEYGNTVKDTCTVNVKFQWWQWLIWILLFGFLWY